MTERMKHRAIKSGIIGSHQSQLCRDHHIEGMLQFSEDIDERSNHVSAKLMRLNGAEFQLETNKNL
jgi:hypothetical protein